ncbi:MAG: hypothetical protein M1834_005232 [Cirrosporium novae-zelandiae]|nr:MAG: hypothetical protein M1834_005232 [Cirrosporium novae-zelandiae]
MSNKLDQSLDEILVNRRQSARRGRGRRTGMTGKPSAPAAPVGGVKKNTRQTKPATKATAASGHAGSKIIVSNLPSDVGEAQIKEYFAATIGPVKKVLVTYNQNGVSRGIASIIFNQTDAANRALKQLNNVNVDKRPMKIEVVLDASEAPAPQPVKPLSERVAQPKAQPKSAVTTKANSVNTRGGRKTRGTRRGRNAGRGKPKTVEELDAEMADYMDTGVTDGAAVPVDTTTANGNTVANGGDDMGIDEIQ